MIQRADETDLPINIEEIIERAFKQAFSRALDRTIQKKAEDLFKMALTRNLRFRGSWKASIPARGQ